MDDYWSNWIISLHFDPADPDRRFLSCMEWNMVRSIWWISEQMLASW